MPNLLVIQALDHPLASDTLYPKLNTSGQVLLASGEKLVWEGKASHVELTHQGHGKLWDIKGVTVVITNKRVVYLCEKYKRGSTWFGFGGIGTLFAGIFMIVSALSAAATRAGKVATGQVRFAWPSLVMSSVSDYDWAGGSVSLMVKDRSGILVLKFTLRNKQDCIAATTALVQQIAEYRIAHDSTPRNKAETAKTLAALTMVDKHEVNGKTTTDYYYLERSTVIPEGA